MIVPQGGLHLAFKRSHVPGSVVCAFDWDQAASRVYSANYGPHIVRQIDISTLQASDLVPFQADTWLLSPSCQPYTTLNPLAKGSADPRAKSFLHLVEDVLPVLVSQGNHPNYLLIENVAGFEVLKNFSLSANTLWMTFLTYRIEGFRYQAASALRSETPWVFYGGASSDTIAVWCTQFSPTILLACKNESSGNPFPK